MITINDHNLEEYLENEVFDAIVEEIRQIVNKQLHSMNEVSVGWISFPSIPTKSMGKQSIYLEYQIKLLRNKVSTDVVPFELVFPYICLFIEQPPPKEIQERMLKVQSLITNPY